ncbi:MAG TPA: DUF5658 family protein [Armatimonadota bacterium]|nr:DUF5658 family protein [Armatimonadota bacterium]HPP74047.1 DUF5658 family protein [Armatimonadota bacterium]
MKESLILIIIGLADLLLTLHLIAVNTATEGNPIMAFYLQFGIGAFVIVKLALLFGPVLVAEWSKRFKPVFVRWMMRGAIAAYLGAYLVGFMLVNVVPIANERDFIPSNKPVVQIAEKTK